MRSAGRGFTTEAQRTQRNTEVLRQNLLHRNKTSGMPVFISGDEISEPSYYCVPDSVRLCVLCVSVVRSSAVPG